MLWDAVRLNRGTVAKHKVAGSTITTLRLCGFSEPCGVKRGIVGFAKPLFLHPLVAVRGELRHPRNGMAFKRSLLGAGSPSKIAALYRTRSNSSPHPSR